MASGDHLGTRVRQLFSGCKTSAMVVAPFIRVNAFRSLIAAVPEGCRIRCVTRWLPKEVAAGVSDPEIYEVLSSRGNGSVFLVDSLHAKLYIADDECLVGSSNVTRRGLGEDPDSNIEVLVRTTTSDPGVRATLSAIQEVRRVATQEMVDSVRRLAKSLTVSTELGRVEELDHRWIPKSLRPQDAYRLYSRPATGFVRTADQVLLADVAGADCQPGLGRSEFEQFIRESLGRISIIREFIRQEGGMLRCVDAYEDLEPHASQDYSVETLWRALVEWTTHFLPDQLISHEISEVALRHGRMG